LISLSYLGYQVGSYSGCEGLEAAIQLASVRLPVLASKV
jgi:hypothetical protein